MPELQNKKIYGEKIGNYFPHWSVIIPVTPSMHAVQLFRDHRHLISTNARLIQPRRMICTAAARIKVRAIIRFDTSGFTCGVKMFWCLLCS